MENVLVEQPVQYRCGRQLDKDGLIACRGILVFKPGELMARCEECCVWVGITAEHLTLMEIQTGAATGAATKWAISRSRGYTGFMLDCAVPGCHFKRVLDAYRVHASAVLEIMNEHPCPTPLPAPIFEIEPLPVAAEKIRVSMTTSEPEPTVEELVKLYPNYSFRYTSAQATSKHAVRNKIGTSEIASQNAAAPCGRSPIWFAPNGWLGTGTQDEYERNDRLPLCKRCKFMLERGSMTHQVKR